MSDMDAFEAYASQGPDDDFDGYSGAPPEDAYDDYPTTGKTTATRPAGGRGAPARGAAPAAPSAPGRTATAGRSPAARSASPLAAPVREATPLPRAATALNDAGSARQAADRNMPAAATRADAAQADVHRPGAEAPGADPSNAPAGAITLTESWATLAARLPLRGLAAQLAQQSEWVGVDGATIVLRVATRTLSEGAGVERLRVVLEAHFGTAVRLRFEIGKTGDNTAYAAAVSERQARQEAAEQTIMADPFVRDLLDQFGGKIVPDSIRPVTPDTQQGTPS